MAEGADKVSGVAGKCKKRGRNKAKCLRYRLGMRQEKNALRRVLRHLRVHVEDASALKALAVLKKALPIVDQRPILKAYGFTV